MPHYMFCAPNVEDANVGGRPFSEHPFVVTRGPGTATSCSWAGEAERARIATEQQALR
jgi:hypothetical protein